MKKGTAIAWAASIAATFIGVMPQRAIAQMQPACTNREDTALSFPSYDSVLCWEQQGQHFYMNVAGEYGTAVKVSLESDRFGGTSLFVNRYSGPGPVGFSYARVEDGFVTNGGSAGVRLATLPWVDLFFQAIQQTTD